MASFIMNNGKTVYGNAASTYWRTWLEYSVDNSYSATQAKVTFAYGIYISKELHKDHTYTKGYDTTYVSCTGETKKTYHPSGTLHRGNCDKGDSLVYGYSYFIIDKSTAKKTVTLSAYIYHPKTYSGYIGKSTAKVAVTISALAKYTVSFNANGGTGAPNAVYKYYGKSVTIPSTQPKRDGYSFKNWNTAKGGSGTTYKSGAKYSANTNATLYAQWGVVDPPRVTGYSVDLSTDTTEIIRGFTDLTVDVTSVYSHSGRTIRSIQMFVGDVGSNVITGTGQLTIQGDAFTADDDGTVGVYIETEDSAGASGRFFLQNVTIKAPTWSKQLSFPIYVEEDGVTYDTRPQITPKGLAVVDNILALNSEGGYDPIGTNGLEYWEDTENWGFTCQFDENHVDDPTSRTPNISTKISYSHVTTKENLIRTAFYATSRNQNYSNGIYNVMFVGGVDMDEYTEYSSRVWWCAVNNPLYFPDTNYSEVGSNDTAIQGLTKVGDYLGVVKQSKTTDTAVFLLYPTSFEEDTTFAVKQGVQGVGALAKYTFNILGDETLFLSPNGVMAIVPSEDNEHKVQNRSYFVDGKLLKEPEIENAYSFVFDGMYYLAIPNGVGSVYVLDGNQRNSWGNDRTNLVYECYYLENVPANCFMKFDDRLAFSNADDVYVVGDSFFDAYDMETGEESAPVKARWSTLLDDDGALHYTKSMQKKGNLVSVLPTENETGYEQVAVDEETFNEDKTLYYTYEDGVYTQCTVDTVYSEETTYYVIYHSKTKVFVKKDNDEPVEIKRSFGQATDIPSELFVKKKFKKYKRLQFILVNEEDEDFGIDSIIKSYTVGSYAKK